MQHGGGDEMSCVFVSRDLDGSFSFTRRSRTLVDPHATWLYILCCAEDTFMVCCTRRVLHCTTTTTTTATHRISGELAEVRRRLFVEAFDSGKKCLCSKNFIDFAILVLDPIQQNKMRSPLPSHRRIYNIRHAHAHIRART